MIPVLQPSIREIDVIEKLCGYYGLQYSILYQSTVHYTTTLHYTHPPHNGELGLAYVGRVQVSPSNYEKGLAPNGH